MLFEIFLNQIVYLLLYRMLSLFIVIVNRFIYNILNLF
nr:MAG TPA: hypothetical protein [Bacteriophage sp.]